MNNLAISVTADAINVEHRLARESAENAVQHAIRCGELLLTKKAELKHGEFMSWVTENCEFSDRSARLYMQAAQNGNALPISAIRQLYGNGTPKGAKREDALQRSYDVGREYCTVDDLAALNSEFGTIYADPPWSYGNQSTRGANEDHYVGMSVNEICALPVAALAAAESHLHLWTTNAFLFDARRVIEAWGFEYKSCFVWVKPQMGMGNYWRVSHEFLLLGVRGSLTFPDKSLRSWGEFRRTQHSEKPEHVRDLIHKSSPGPRLELFARRPVEGWTCWGNEIRREVFAA